MKSPILLVSFMVLFSCSKDKVIDNQAFICTDEVLFAQEIEPLINQYCIGCHSAGSSYGGYNLEGHSNIANQSQQILGAMQADGFQLMPIGGPALNDTLIQRFRCWIEQGKLDN